MEHLLAGVYRVGPWNAGINLKILEVGGFREGIGVGKGGSFQRSTASSGQGLCQLWEEVLL